MLLKNMGKCLYIYLIFVIFSTASSFWGTKIHQQFIHGSFVFVFMNFQKVQLEGGQDVCGPFYSHPGSWLICLILLLNSLSLFSAEPTFYNFLRHTISCQKHLEPDLSLDTISFCVKDHFHILGNLSEFVFDLADHPIVCLVRLLLSKYQQQQQKSNRNHIKMSYFQLLKIPKCTTLLWQSICWQINHLQMDAAPCGWTDRIGPPKLINIINTSRVGEAFLPIYITHFRRAKVARGYLGSLGEFFWYLNSPIGEYYFAWYI